MDEGVGGGDVEVLAVCRPPATINNENSTNVNKCVRLMLRS